MTEKLRIPDKWLAGYLRANPDATVADAVAHWQEQERMEREVKARIRKRLNSIGLPPLSKYKP